MPTENGLLIDLEEFNKVIEMADVFAVAFRHMPERLLVDARSNDTDGPLIAVVQPVKSATERFFWLGQKRPSFGMPERFMFFPWPHSIAFFDESGIWESICRRVLESSVPDTQHMLDSVLADLVERERRATVAAIVGSGYQQVWPKP